MSLSQLKLREAKRRYYYRSGRSYQREYRRNFCKTKAHIYVGVVVCPKCGQKGYGQIRKYVNTKTGTVHCTWLGVAHHHTEHGKTVYDGYCYIAVVKSLADAKRLLSEDSN